MRGIYDFLVGTARAAVGRWRDQRAPESLAWDADWGTETASFDLGNYEPTPPAVVGAVLDAVDRALGPAVGAATLVDLGCGKGRVLLIAAERSFHRVIGVEVRAALVDVCRNNLTRFALRHPERRAPEVVWGDASEIVLPAGTRVLYLYNPFPPGTLAAVLRKEQGPDVWLAYVHPLDESIAISAGFREVDRGAGDPAWVLMRRAG
jgi:SAM-dependent methyltransferase